MRLQCNHHVAQETERPWEDRKHGTWNRQRGSSVNREPDGLLVSSSNRKEPCGCGCLEPIQHVCSAESILLIC